MHQNLIDRDDLRRGASACMRSSELGQDYLKAGLLDRAEEIFNQAASAPRFEAEAKRNLLEIYQVEKEWQKAIDLARELPDVASAAGGRRVLLRTGCRRDHALAAGRRRVRHLEAAMQAEPQVRPRQPAAGRPAAAGGRRRGRHRGLAAHRAAGRRPIWRWSRSACSMPTASSAGATRASPCCAATSSAIPRSTCSTSSTS